MTLLSYGFIALDLLSIIPEDAGEYTCRVTSSSGTAQSSAILVVTGIVVESIVKKIIWRFLKRIKTMLFFQAKTKSINLVSTRIV